MVMPHSRQRRSRLAAFTLIELLVVLAIMATLMSIVAPRYFESVNKAKEAALRTNLRIMREAIDKYRADMGEYPGSLKALVDARYVRNLPVDPITESDATWKLVAPPSTTASGVYDVHSGAPGKGSDGKAFEQW